MQMEADLMLEKAVTLVRQSETVKTQQPAVRGESSQPTGIEAVKEVSGSQKARNRSHRQSTKGHDCVSDVENQASYQIAVPSK